MRDVGPLLVERLKLSLNSGARVHVPEAGRIAWGWFVDLCATRTYGAGGPNPIAFAEIEAYARLHRWPLEPHHVGLLRALDRAWLEHVRANTGMGTSPTVPRSSGQAINPAAFDAVFGR